MAVVAESLALAGFDLPVLWLRYNPGDFTEDGQTARVLRSERERQLLEFVTEWAFPVGGDQRTFIKYMFYDREDGELSVHMDAEYHPQFKACCVD